MISRLAPHVASPPAREGSGWRACRICCGTGCLSHCEGNCVCPDCSGRGEIEMAAEPKGEREEFRRRGREGRAWIFR
jgi:hypothetical protein